MQDKHCEIMNKGKFVFSQVIDFLPRYEFDKIVKIYNGDYRYRHLTSYNHLLHLIFGQLTGYNPLRDICLSLKAHEKWFYQNQNLKELNLFEF